MGVRKGLDMLQAPDPDSTSSTHDSAQSHALPVWIRLPKPGTMCPYTGLSRSAINGLILGPNPPVRSVSLRQRFALRGTRLIHFQSLLDYIERAAESSQQGGTQ